MTKARRHGPQKWEATVKCLSAAVAVPDAAFVKKGIPEYESPRDEHVDHALVSSMVSEVDGNDKVLVKVRCEYIRPRKTVSGVFVVSKAGLTFKEADTRRNQEGGNNVSEVRAKTHFWDKDTVCQMYTRRYKLCRTAIEIFFGDKTNCFLNFETVRIRAYVFSKILSGLKPPNLARVVGSSSSPGDALKRSGLTEKWRRREVSNFDYLMALNTMAGRSFNDATQYPVFPWVVSDYTSETLDFSDPMVFRDLSKPIGSHDPGAISLYSSATSVRYFLGRLEPFTSSIIPSTRSDAFTSISAAWARNSWELTPEFFTLPDFLLGGKDGDVALPTWARGSADEFIRINRAALESDYVSAHLNEWVDLVFGCKQRGAEAVETNNLYASIAYEGVIDYTKLRSDVRLQISAFGQIPDQLLASPHPQRVAVAPAEDSGRTSAAVSIFQDPENVLSWAAKVFSGPVVCVRPGAEPGTVIAVNPLCEVCTYRVERRRTDTAPTLRLVSTAQAPSSKPPHLARDTTFSPALFAVSDGRLFSCGFWDGSFRVLSLGTTAPVASVLAHRGIVTCVAAEQGTLVAGFRDTTLMLWDIPPLSAGVAGIVTGNTRKVMNHPRCVLYGHDEKVTAVDISKTLGIVASGALDGRVVVHALRTGKYVWSGVPVLAHPISCVRIIPQAKVIAVYSREKFSIAFCSLSGRTLAELKVQDKFNDMAATADGRFLVLGGKGAMCVFSLSSVSSGTVSFSHAYNIGANVSVCSLAISPDQNVLFAGLDNGNILSVSGQQQRQ